MKSTFSSMILRVVIATLLLACSVLMGTSALVDVNHKTLKQLRRVPILAGPTRYAEAAAKFGSFPQQQHAANNASTIAVQAPDSGEYVGFEVFEAPGNLVNVTTSSQGPAVSTVEYLAHDAGEPSIGVNWQSTQDTVNGITAFQSDLQTAFIKFDDSCTLGTPKASWYMSQAPTSLVVDSDPIGFVDRDTGRTFCGQLTLTTPTCKISFTDTDGKDPLGTPGPAGWTASLSTLGSGIDHETIGGGPYHAPIPPPPTYAHAVYFASQDLVTAFALRSDDGGATWGPPITMYTSQCGGLHGHIKVAPDGTVYLPNNNCAGTGAVIASTDNGLTWAIRPVPGTVANPNLQDPAATVDASGRVYFVMSSNAPLINGTKAIVATSTDQGLTWANLFDVGASYNLKNIAYPAAIAGDDGRAAVAFYGSTMAGPESGNSFTGVWHLYVAETFDGGLTWVTTDVTPNAPMQRGCIWMQGGADICRNLLDFFDMTMDKQGRVQVGYVDGCAGGHCSQAANTATGNAYTALGAIARQSAGKRLLAAFDPPDTTSAPGMPLVTARRVGPVVHLLWSLGDSGNLPITNYQIYRGTSSGSETLLTTLPGTQTGGTYDDNGASDPTQTYYYKIIVNNSLGASCDNNEIAVPYVGDTCTGLIVQQTPTNHPEQQLQGAAPASLAIDYIAVAEPPNTNNIAFKMKVTDLSGGPPVNSRWRIVWNSYAAQSYDPGDAEQFYVGMRSDNNGATTFEYGTVATAVVGLVIGVPTETMRGAALPESNFAPDGTITIVIPKSVIGNPQAGDLLGAINGRTFTGDTDQTRDLERSTLLVDHTFVKAQRDNGEPAATYTIVGNTACPSLPIVPVNVVSRKTHGSAGDWDIDLPLTGNPGIECRIGQGANSDSHQIVVTFASAVTISGNPPATITSGSAQVDSVDVNGSVVTVNLTNVANAQVVTLQLNDVSDGTNTDNVVIPIAFLLGDTNANGAVNAADISQTKSQSGNSVGGNNFREDVNVNGSINAADIAVVKAQSGTGLP